MRRLRSTASPRMGTLVLVLFSTLVGNVKAVHSALYSAAPPQAKTLGVLGGLSRLRRMLTILLLVMGAHPVGSTCDETSSISDWGYSSDLRGWYDVQGCGLCKDYCRTVGSGWLACQIGSGYAYQTSWSATGWVQGGAFPYARCSGRNAQSNAVPTQLPPPPPPSPSPPPPLSPSPPTARWPGALANSDFTLQADVYCDTPNDGRYKPIIALQTGFTNVDCAFNLQIQNNGDINFFMGNGAGYGVAFDAGNLAAATWTHIMVQMIGTAVTVTVDGTVSGTGTFTGTRQITNSELITVGLYDPCCGPGTSQSFVGEIRNVHFAAHVPPSLPLPPPSPSPAQWPGALANGDFTLQADVYCDTPKRADLASLLLQPPSVSASTDVSSSS